MDNGGVRLTSIPSLMSNSHHSSFKSYESPFVDEYAYMQSMQTNDKLRVTSPSISPDSVKPSNDSDSENVDEYTFVRTISPNNRSLNLLKSGSIDTVSNGKASLKAKQDYSSEHPSSNNKITSLCSQSTSHVANQIEVSENPDLAGLNNEEVAVSRNNSQKSTILTPPSKFKILPISKNRLTASSCYPIHTNYIIKERIGKGAWGSVHVAVERASGLERAVKKFPKRVAKQPLLFRNEMQLLSYLDHPNIVRIYETYEDYTNFYLIVELCRGGDLFERIAAYRFFTEETAARLAQQMLSAVNYIHSQNIAHRDLKPENFLFLSNREMSPLKLVDFGLSKQLRGKRALESMVGSILYMAPEVLTGEYSEKCDIWSIGIIVYILLSGVVPFTAQTMKEKTLEFQTKNICLTSKVWQPISFYAKDFVARLLCKDPSERITASAALNHDWFKMFSPLLFKELKLPRHTSMPACYFEYHGRCLRQSEEEDQDFPPTHTNITASQNSSPPLLNSFFNNQKLSQNSSLISHSTEYALSSEMLRCLPFPGESAENTSFSTACVKCLCLKGPSTPGSLSLAQARKHPSAPILYSPGSANNSRGQCDALQDMCSYFKQFPKSQLLVWKNLASSLVPRWRKFSMKNALKRVILHLIAHNLSDEDDSLDTLRSLFLALDWKSEGRLSSSKISSGIQALTSVSSTRSRMQKSASYVAICSTCHELSSSPVYLRSSETQDDEEANESYEGLSTSSSKRIVAASVTNEAKSVANNFQDEEQISSSQHSLSNDVKDAVPSDLINAVSLDGSGALGYCDYLAASIEKKHYIKDNILKAAFHVFDRDGDGNIQLSDIRARLGWSELADSYSSYSKAIVERGQMIEKELKIIMEDWDRDKDGCISYEDFIQTLQDDNEEDHENASQSCITELS